MRPAATGHRSIKHPSGCFFVGDFKHANWRELDFAVGFAYMLENYNKTRFFVNFILINGLPVVFLFGMRFALSWRSINGFNKSWVSQH